MAKQTIPFGLTNRQVISLTRGLQDFGYKSLTYDGVIAALVKIETKQDYSTDIIAMFVAKQLKDAGLLANEPTKDE